MIECIFTIDYEIYGNGEGPMRELLHTGPASFLPERVPSGADCITTKMGARGRVIANEVTCVSMTQATTPAT